MFLVLATWAAGCGAPKPAAGPRRYSLSGRVVSLQEAQKQVTVDHGDIEGFMGAMTMPYVVKDAAALGSLAPGDQITADVVASDTEVWLENIVVVQKGNQAAPPEPEPKAPAKQ
jgi:protein SCO1/2